MTRGSFGPDRGELSTRGSESDRRAARASDLVASIQAAATEAQAAAAKLPRISRLAARAPSRTRPVRAGSERSAVLTAAGTVSDDLAGTLAEGVRREMANASSWSANPSRTVLATVEAVTADDRRLGSDEVENGALIAAAGTPILTASGGVCGPVGVSYVVPALGDPSRPVRDGACVVLEAPRGGLRYVLPHTLAAVTADAPSAIWTEATDAAPGGATKAHATFTCQPVQEVYVDAVTSIVQLGNFQSRYFGEQVAEYLAEAAAVHARLGDSTVLAAVIAGSTAVTADSYELGASRDLLAILDRAVAAMRFRHRTLARAPLRVVLPSFLRSMVRADQARQLPGDSYSGAERLAIADSLIDSWFPARSINVTETLDSPAGAATVQGFGAQGAGQLLPWPATTTVLLYPEGTWTFLDGGSLDLGLVRDSILNRTNDLQMFSETFENVIFVGHESLALTLKLAPTGATAGTVATATAETLGS